MFQVHIDWHADMQHFATTTLKFGLAKCSVTISYTYAAIPRARVILPRHNKTGPPKPGASNSDTWRISVTKVADQNSISYWDEDTVRSLRFPDRPRTLEYSVDGRYSSAFGTVYYLNQDNPVSNCPNSYASLHARRPSIQ